MLLRYFNKHSYFLNRILIFNLHIYFHISEFLVVVSSTSCFWMCMLNKLIRTRITVCSVSFHHAASIRVRYPQTTTAAHILEFEVSRCKMFHFASCLVPAQVRMRNQDVLIRRWSQQRRLLARYVNQRNSVLTLVYILHFVSAVTR